MAARRWATVSGNHPNTDLCPHTARPTRHRPTTTQRRPVRTGPDPGGPHSSMADDHGGSHLLSLIRSTVPPMHPGGRPIVLGVAAGGLALRTVLRKVGARRAGGMVGRTGAALTLASAFFFREPRRVTPTAVDVVVAPADGLVSLIEEAAPPPELGLDATPLTRISIFLSVFDVHVQRIPVTGIVTHRAYRPGKFLSADLDKASEDNERNSLVIGAAGGRDGGGHPDRRAHRAPHRVRRQRGRAGAGRADIRPDSFRFPAGHLPPSRVGRRRCCSASAQSGARRCLATLASG